VVERRADADVIDVRADGDVLVGQRGVAARENGDDVLRRRRGGPVDEADSPGERLARRTDGE
jgi:hypothetical protein